MAFTYRTSTLLGVVALVLLLLGAYVPHASMVPAAGGISPPVELAQDPGAEMTLEDVLTGALDFRSMESTTERLGTTSAAIWLRIRLDNPTPEPVTPWLSLGTARLHFITLHEPRTSGWQSFESGMALPFSSRSDATIAPVFPLDLEPHSSNDIYVRVATETLMTVRPELWDPVDYLHAEARQTRQYYFGTGATLLAAIICLVASIILRESGLFVFGLAISSYQMFRWSASGLAFRELWPEAPFWAMNSVGVFLSLTGLLFVLSHRLLLNTRRDFPRMDRLLLVLLACFTILLIMTLLGPNRLVMAAIMLPGIPLSIISPILGYMAWRRGAPLFGYCLAGYMLPWHLLVMQYLLSIGWLPELPDIVVDYNRAWAVLLSAAIVLSALGTRIIDLGQNLVRAERVRREQLEMEVDQRTSELNTAKKKAEGTLNDQRQLLNMVSHEFRTPLASIGAATQLLELESTPGQDAAALKRINRAISRLSSFLENCLTEERMNTDGWVRHAEDVDLPRLLDDVLENARSPYPRHTFSLDMEPNEIVLSCDRQLFQVLLGNLLGNAAKYAPEGSVITLQTRLDELGQLHLAVTDQGAGITEDEVDRVFTKFYRGSRAGNVPGAGLGLFLVERIATLHDAQIRVESPPDQGTRITVIFPTESVRA
ncbi:MAG: sensor histidine kinase [Aquisalimonadaceae bacterium]